jgi:lysyl-tRNA synthetase class 1
MEKAEHKHWSEWLADRVISEKKEPYIITGGMTTSGPVHFGTLCELLFPEAIKKELEAKGKTVSYFFIADIFDAFDSVPLDMEKYKAQLEPHLGKPLCDVPDPTGKSMSFGDHYLEEARALVKKFGISCTFVRINEYYAQGKFDEWARFYLKHEKEAKRIVEETSGKTEKKDWSPIMPLCANCGRISTTRVLSQDGENYEYVCDKDVKYTKGCGFHGKAKISDHRYKLTWRLHWPAWKQIFHTSIEGAGMDHHTKGGSEDTCKAITLDLMKADYHIPFKYGFILFQGKKYSKSKGTGMGMTEISGLLPPEIVKYMLLKPDLEENIDINPTSENLLRTIEDFEGASRLDLSKEDISRSDRKRAIAFNLSTDKLGWSASFLDMLLFYQIYRDWNEVGTRIGDPSGAAYLRPYIEEWVARDFMPEDYRFKYLPGAMPASENVKKLLSSLDGGMDALAIHNAVFDFAKANNIEPKALFAELYRALLGKERGPRLGKLLFALGVERVKKDLI